MVDFCNLTSLVVDEAHRARSMDLLSALLGQKGFSFTNFTPTESVAKMLGLFGFRTLRAGDRIVVNTPTPPALLGLRAAEGRGVLDAVLDGQAARLWRDHRDIPWLRSFAVGRGNDWCLVFWTPSHVKGLRAARIVGVSDTARYLDWNSAIGGHLMLRHGMLASRIEDFMLPENARLGISRPTGTPRLLRGEPADDTQVSFLYSELVALPL